MREGTKKNPHVIDSPELVENPAIVRLNALFERLLVCNITVDKYLEKYGNLNNKCSITYLINLATRHIVKLLETGNKELALRILEGSKYFLKKGFDYHNIDGDNALNFLAYYRELKIRTRPETWFVQGLYATGIVSAMIEEELAAIALEQLTGYGKS